MGLIDLPKDQIIKFYCNGMSTTQIAAKYNVTSATIRRRLNQWGIDTAIIKYQNFCGYRPSEVYSMYRQGHSIRYLADYFAVSIYTVYNYLRDNGFRCNTTKSDMINRLVSVGDYNRGKLWAMTKAQIKKICRREFGDESNIDDNKIK